MKQFACGAVVPDCKAVFMASTEEGILAQVAEHARHDHGLDTIPAELVRAVRSNIATVAA